MSLWQPQAGTIFENAKQKRYILGMFTPFDKKQNPTPTDRYYTVLSSWIHCPSTRFFFFYINTNSSKYFTNTHTHTQQLKHHTQRPHQCVCPWYETLPSIVLLSVKPWWRLPTNLNLLVYFNNKPAFLSTSTVLEELLNFLFTSYGMSGVIISGDL